MRWPINVAMLAIVLCSSGAALAQGRFLLIVSNDIPADAFVDAAYEEARVVVAPVKPGEANRRLTAAFPGLYSQTSSSDRQALDAELANGRVAHYNSSFKQAEVHYKAAFELLDAYPELLGGDQVLSQRLVDAALLRYANAMALNPKSKVAPATLKEFARRYTSLTPTSTDFPPPVLKAWHAAHTTTNEGKLMVHVQPHSLERSGECRLLLNGADAGQMPLGGPLHLPVGSHRVQVRCGMRRSWSRHVNVAASTVTSLRVPVRAMMAARVHQGSGAIVIVEPAEGDTADLVAAISEGTGFEGAVVVRTAIGRANLGRWDRGAEGPSHERTGTIVGDRIVDVRKADAGSDGVGALPIIGWSSVAVGAGLLIGGAVVNGDYNDKITAQGSSSSEVNSLRDTSVALYVTGGVVAATGVVLVIIDAVSGSDDEEQAALQVGAKGLAWRF